MVSLFIRENNDPYNAASVENCIIIYSKHKHEYGTDELMSWDVIRISMGYTYSLEL